VRNLVFLSSHTYTVTAVDRFGRESAHSAPVTRQAVVGGPFGCGMTAPSGLVATQVTASSVSLQWSNVVPSWDQSATLIVYADGAVGAQTTLDSARIGGLTPATAHTFQVARRDCSGGLHPGAPITVTTGAGAAARPAAPAAVTVGARTNSSVALSWTPRPGVDPTVGYTVYDGGTRVATTAATAVTVAGLWRDTAHVFSVTAVDAAGNESPAAAANPWPVQTLPCDTAPPAPVGLVATPVSPSSVALSWVSNVEAASFTVYAGGTSGAIRPVATLPTPSAMITGLPSGSTNAFTVVATLAGCGTTPGSAIVYATTPAGPPARPTAATDLRATVGAPSFDNTAPVTLSWTQPPTLDPVVGYRVYEGRNVLVASATSSVTLRLPSGPSHTVSVVGLDAAGNESTQSTTATFTVPFIGVP
jgi:chitodextrinase